MLGVELCNIENCVNIACQKLHPFDEKKRYCEFADECQRIICPYVHPGVLFFVIKIYSFGNVNPVVQVIQPNYGNVEIVVQMYYI